MKERIDKFIRHPRKALFILALPVVIGMTVQTLYNVVDTIFVGRLGADSIAALTYTFPIFFIIIALNSGLGVGVNSSISRLVGAGKRKQAEKAAAHAFLIALVLGVLVTVLGLLFLRPMLILFGATGHVLELSHSFMSIVLSCSIFTFLGWAINSIFTGQGDTKTTMTIQVISLVVNIILDPLLIYTFGFGVRGAGMATAIAFFTTFLLGLYFMYYQDRAHVKLRLKGFRFFWPTAKDILRVGFPAALMQLVMSIYLVFINIFMTRFGTDYVAAFGLASRIESIAIMPIVGVSISLLTLTGMFLGAKRLDLLRSIVWFGVIVSTAFSCAMGLVFFLLPELFFRVFTPDPVLISLSASYMRIDVLTFPMMAIGLAIARAMQGMGDGTPGLVVTLTRVLFVFVPLGYLFVDVLGFGFLSIPWAMVIAGFMSSVLGLYWLHCKLKAIVDKMPCRPAR